MKKKKYIWIFGVAFFVLVSYFFYKNYNSNEEKTRYITEIAGKEDIAVIISTTGNIIVDEQATVDPTISGTVNSLSVNVGDQVEKGQFLFNIINDDLAVQSAQADVSIQQAQNSVFSAELNLKEAKSNYSKAKEEDEDDDDAYTKKELEILKDKIKIAENNLLQAQKNLVASQISYKNQKANSAKRTVISPISGTVQELNIKNGDDLSRTASSGNVSPITIGDLETMKALVKINEIDISKIEIGQSAELSFDAIDGLKIKGKVEQINSLGNESQGVITYDVKVGFVEDVSSKIKPQMSVSVAIISAEKKEALSVPASAIKSFAGGYFVEVLNKNSLLEKRRVETGLSGDTKTEIISGLKEGEEVIIKTVLIDEESASGNKATNSSRGMGGIPGMSGTMRTR